ncbi:54S ribosomal protein yml6 mitochondrial [Zalerion maritima]|uniref:Large ribosomal subunit protein uL4m n=1 Tax=Zalerion maritima TaxID=339359 RepID=A0AAD5RYN3_9PEZI|nr:54S ribosomal protein yml6 mitochondrial [Zalerion maritima]
MAGKTPRSLAEAMKALSLASGSTRPTILGKFPNPCAAKTMATEAPRPGNSHIPYSEERIPLWRPDAKVPLTIHSFPSLEPKSLEYWSVQHLHVPMRKDLLHLAIVYEGDNTRQGTAHVKNAWEVAGSHRKLYRQKGTGMARAGWKQSPIRKGGGKAHGPRKNRDFTTQLTRKVYDQAWRIALSYRYRRGELIVVEENGLELPVRQDFVDLCKAGTMRPELEESFYKRYVAEVLNAQALGKAAGRTLFVAKNRRDLLWRGLGFAGEHGEVATIDEIDVKDLLEKGKVVMERNVLKELIARHQCDLVNQFAIHGWVNKGPPIGQLALKAD